MAIEVNDDSFTAEVLDRSLSQAVVVDFTASWCGPAMAVSPKLEDVAAMHGSRVALVQVDIDVSPRTAKTYNIYSLPTVKAFRHGVEVDEMQGVPPIEMIQDFFDKLDQQIEVTLGDDESRRAALEADPNHAAAALPLARGHYERGEIDEALAILGGVKDSLAADGLRVRIEIEQAGTPDLAPVFAALDAGDHDSGLEQLIDAVPGAGEDRDKLRRVVLGVLDELGPADPRTTAYRRRLSSAMY